MKGDLYRAIAEFAVADKRNLWAQKAIQAYNEGLNIANKSLFPKTHPILLGILLNFAVLNYDVLKNPEEACKMG